MEDHHGELVESEQPRSILFCFLSCYIFWFREDYASEYSSCCENFIYLIIYFENFICNCHQKIQFFSFLFSKLSVIYCSCCSNQQTDVDDYEDVKNVDGEDDCLSSDGIVWSLPFIRLTSRYAASNIRLI